eukprot:CCRYP_009871-RA/>CCRYP_009871-RA protein AED:0.05 eAED:0.05 QI:118/1/1/1/1/1/6/214/1064
MTTSSLFQRCLLARRQRTISLSESSICCRSLGNLSFNGAGSVRMRELLPPAGVRQRVRTRSIDYSHLMHLRRLSTKTTNENIRSPLSGPKIRARHEEHFISREEAPEEDVSDSNITARYTPRNEHQRKLLDYTNSLLSVLDNTFPVGSYPITHIIQISNCIDSWLASGEHRYLGVQQAELLVKRLIMERGGGRSLVNKEAGETTFIKGNQAVTWDMYHFESLILSLNILYDGEEFINRILSIVSTFEEEFADTIEVQYKSIIAILCKCDTAHAANAAEQVLHNFESKFFSSSTKSAAEQSFLHSNPPTTETYNNIITCWVNSGQDFYHHSYTNYRHSPHPPANILSEMISLYERNPQDLSRIRPDRITFNMVLTSLSYHQRSEQSTFSSQYLKEIKQSSFDFLRTMLKYYKGGCDECAPDMVTFSTVLNIISRGPPEHEDGHRASQLLDDMLDLSASGLYKYDVTPPAKHFNVVLGLMADQKRVDDSTFDKARRYVQLMEQLAKQDVPRSIDVEQYLESLSPPSLQPEDNSSFTSSKPDSVTYNSLIKIASNAGMPETSHEILNEMIKRSLEGDESVKPDVISFNTVLNAWSKSKKPTIGAKSAEILHTMQKLSERGDFNVKPDNVSLTTVINSLIKSSKRTRGAPIQAEAIIQKMDENEDYAFKPDTITYTSLIKCWSESGRPKAASRAEEIIELLHRRYDEGHDECKPDSMAYNVALNAIAKSGVPRSAERAEALLQRMKDRFDAGDVDLAPNTFSFSTVIYAWSKSGNPNAGKHAERLLDTMIELHAKGVHDVAPNTITYSSCIHAWSKSGQKDAGRRASSLLKRMDRHDEEGFINIKPNAYSFTSAIEAWINSRDPNLLREAEHIFEVLIERYQSGDDDAAPTTATFNAMFKAIRQCPSEKKKFLKAEQLMSKMKQMYELGNQARPDIATYNSYFSACACTEGDRTTKLAAIACVLNTLTELQENARLRPDSYTWPAIWKACENLLDIEQDIQRINMVFELCVRSGAISELVFSNMRNFLPPQYLQKKLNTTGNVKKLTVRDLPPEWTCNVKLRRIRNKR